MEIVDGDWRRRLEMEIKDWRWRWRLEIGDWRWRLEMEKEIGDRDRR